MILFFFLPFSASIFFLTTGLTLLALLVVLYFSKGQVRQGIMIAINVVSVVTFIGFLFSLGGVVTWCSPWREGLLVISIIAFFLLLGGLFYYIQRK